MAEFLENIVSVYEDFTLCTGVSLSAFDSYTKEFLKGYDCEFCKKCSFNGTAKCIAINTHKYGVYESERWDGLYIYYCPLGLIFVATTVYASTDPLYALICGPIVMGSMPDTASEADSVTLQLMNQLPVRSPDRVSAFAKTQQVLAKYLTESMGNALQLRSHSQMNNTMYDIILSMQDTGEYNYPFDIENQLQNMITNGDKQGAQELINQLLGQLYFKTGGDFEMIKLRAYELVVMFSRGAIAGGADTKQIFGDNQDILLNISRFSSIYDLSNYLTSIFNRFVGYVFDFEQAQHSDIIHKAINFIRSNYTQKITLQDVADHVYLSKSYFSRLFKEEISTSFTEYVNSMRINKSKELLVSSNLSISEISTSVGFNDQSYFTKVFVKNTNVSPGHFRKSGGKI